MKNRSELSPSNLLAQLEATADLDLEASDELRELASQTARTVHNEMNRMWRARRRPSPGRSKFMRRVGVPLTLFFSLCLSLRGVTCDRAGCGTIRQGNAIVCFTPARPTSLYGELKAVDPNPLPAERDTTNFNEVSEYYYRRNWFFGMDVENGWILAGLAHGIGIWDARTNPSRPTFVSSRLFGPGQAFPEIPSGESSKIVFGGIDAPDDTVAALAGYGGGTLVFDLRNKQAPVPVYQHIVSAESVYATTLRGTRYAFVASWAPAGVYIYNLDRALSANGCLDHASDPSGSTCNGALAGKISPPGTPYFTHGVGNYLAVSFGSSSGFQIYDVANPTSPMVKLTGLRGAQARAVQGVALWSQGTSYYLGARLSASLTAGPQTAIYDVSCITSAAGCASLGAPLAIVETPAGGDNYLTFSRANGVTPFLYAGTDAYCSGDDGKQREWLFDVTNPVAPRDVTPTVTVPVAGIYNGVPRTVRVNYWSYYYRGSPTGFNLVAPHAGKFYGSYFYRAARSIFDIHQWSPATPPVASFQYSPGTPAPGQLVQFQSTASGSPTSFRWSFSGGLPSSATGASVSTRWNRPGFKSLTHTACNGSGCNSISTNLGVATFSDVPPSHWAWPAIEALAVARVTAGCAVSPARFCPESLVTRADLAVLLVRAKRGASYVPPPARGVFPDVPVSFWAAAYIEQLARDGFAAGLPAVCGAGLFCPGALVTRAEIAVLLEFLKRGISYVPTFPSGVFVDVPVTHWAARYIEQIFRDGITAGCGVSPRRFCPNALVTRAEGAVFLQRTLLLPSP
jgi:PKD repeat protein